MAKFCGKCGTRLDEITGLCPRCDGQASVPSAHELSDYETKQAVEPNKKKQHGKGHYFLKFIAAILVLAVLVSGTIGLLAYFGVVEIPLLNERQETFERQNESVQRKGKCSSDMIESASISESGKNVNITVIHGDGTESGVAICTEAEDLADVLLEISWSVNENKQPEWSLQVDDQTGRLYIVTVDGETADENRGQWWSVTKEGEPLSRHIMNTVVADGDHYELTLVEDKNVDTEFVIGICQFVQHELLDAATQGFQDAVSDLIGNSVTFSFVNADGDEAQCDEAMADFVAEDVDLILAVATSPLQAAARATSDIPILATATTDYGSALGVADPSDLMGKNISGTCDSKIDQDTSSYYALGYKTGEMAYEVLVEGVDIGTIPISYGD